MSNFHVLPETLRAMAAAKIDPAAGGAVRLLAIGELLGAGVLRSQTADPHLHRQPRHEELLIVLEGEGLFQVAEEVRQVGPGDFIFVPRDTPHGIVSIEVAPLSLLSILTPQFDPARDMVWEEGAEPRTYQMV